MIGQPVYARAGSTACTLEDTGSARVGVIIAHQQGNLFTVRTKNNTVIDVYVETPKPLLILEERVSKLGLSDRWIGEVNHQMAEEFGTRNIKLFLPHQVTVVRMNFMLDDYEMRLVSENGGSERYLTFATVLMAWKRATDDNKR